MICNWYQLQSVLESININEIFYFLFTILMAVLKLVIVTRPYYFCSEVNRMHL